MDLDTQISLELIRRGGLYEFVKQAWSQVESVEFIDNWHIEQVCKALEASSRGELKRLIINVPPGTGKSLIVSVFWPAWMWTFDPGHRWFNASFDQGLVNRDASRLISLVQSKWFQDRWPNVYTATETGEPKVNVPKSEFWTTSKGLRFSTSIRGKGTGYHAHTQVVDDPLKPKDAKTGKSTAPDKVALKEVIDWRKDTLSTRAINLGELRMVIIMQRLHENDLVGYLEENEEGWVKVCFPMRYEQALHTRIELKDGSVIEDPRRTEGELLYPARYPETAVRDLEKNMGPQTAAAQLQQRPAPAEGNMFKKQWFKHYDVIPQDFDYLLQSWDMSFKDSDGSDNVGGDLWGVRGADVYLLPGWIDERLSFTQTIAKMEAFCKATPWHERAFLKLVEDKANGPAVVDTLNKKIAGLVLVNPEGSKVARANSVTPFYESGNVYHPSKLLDPRIEAREHVLMSFPNVKKDEVVDTTSQVLLRIFVRSANLAQAVKVWNGG